jgi:uncharacterized protein (DUF1330 family)
MSIELNNWKSCLCGCGTLIPIVDKWGHKSKYKLGHHSLGKKYSIEHRNKLSKAAQGKHVGSKSPLWKGGRTKHNGYILIKKLDHPFADYLGYVREHRLVMEKHLGRYLTRDEVVHHINGIRNDNRLENLQLMKDSEHRRHHKLKNIV